LVEAELWVRGQLHSLVNGARSSTRSERHKHERRLEQLTARLERLTRTRPEFENLKLVPPFDAPEYFATRRLQVKAVLSVLRRARDTVLTDMAALARGGTVSTPRRLSLHDVPDSSLPARIERLRQDVEEFCDELDYWSHGKEGGTSPRGDSIGAELEASKRMALAELSKAAADARDAEIRRADTLKEIDELLADLGRAIRREHLLLEIGKSADSIDLAVYSDPRNHTSEPLSRYIIAVQQRVARLVLRRVDPVPMQLIAAPDVESVRTALIAEIGRIAARLTFRG
jgi:hypothetical protein